MIAGLGNPGPEYAGTRHNVGWMVVERLIETHSLTPRTRREGVIAELNVNDADVFLFKPASYVNTSGKAIKSIVNETGVEAPGLIIVHDDLDLDFGELRIKAAGRSGGHRGIDSVIDALQSDEFPRVKIGIGRPPGKMEPADFVLKPFKEDEIPEIEITVSEAAEAALAIIEQGLETAMNRYNQRRK